VKRQRRLKSGKAITVERRDGVRKRCDCPKRQQATCDHPWFFAFKWQDTHYRFPLGRPFTWKGQPLRCPAEGAVKSRDEAKNEADRLRTAIRNGHFPPVAKPTAATPSDVTFETFSEKFRERARATDPNVGDSTRAQDAAIHISLCKMLIGGERFGARLIGAITEDDWEAAFGQLTLAASSWNKYRNYLRMLQAWGVKKGYLVRPWVSEDNETIRHRSEKGDKRERRLLPDVVDSTGKLKTSGEEKRLLAKASPWLQRLIIAALETGMRRGELLSLQWRDVDLIRGRFSVRAENGQERHESPCPDLAAPEGHPGHDRQGPQSEDHKAGAFVFGDPVGGQIKDPKKSWLACCKEAAITGLHFHDLRHEAGSRMLEAGWPLSHVQRVLGHKDAATTSRYLNASDEHVDDSMARFGVQPLHALAHEASPEPPPPVQGESLAAAKLSVN
jgi:integrase